MTFAQSWLSEEQIGLLRGELERNLNRLQRSLKVRSVQSREIDQTAVGRLSRVEALQNRGFKQKLEERETTHFDEVVQALGRLDDGSYGLCTSCRDPIRFERLLIFPEARTCTGCGGTH